MQPHDVTRGEWMQTYSGRAFYPRDPRPQDVDPADIAHALSLLCRYGGHTTKFFSVAEHSVLMSYAVTPANALWALLHDAGEAYIQDLIRPLKHAIPQYQQIEDRLMAVICERLGLPGCCPDEVKAADTRILLDERAALLAPSARPWTSLDGLQPLGVRVRGWAPAVAERRFLVRLNELGVAVEIPDLVDEVRDDTVLAEARGRREAYNIARIALANELRGAPYNAPGQTQITYVGGLARARRLLERLYRAALLAEEDLVLAGDDPPAAVEAAP